MYNDNKSTAKQRHFCNSASYILKYLKGKRI